MHLLLLILSMRCSQQGLQNPTRAGNDKLAGREGLVELRWP
uniref:Uncharacterized protein n=1 Tax=Macrostomum lignano TaxID=282301 RepID=A0A1I8GAN6_9PLAT